MPDPAIQRSATVTATQPPQTLLGFDYGLRRIGVAVGQRITGTARGLTVLQARDGQPDWSEIAALIATWQPQRLVVGLPLYLDGSVSEMTAAAQRFARRLHGRFGLPVDLHDERLSSHAAAAWLETRPVKQADGAAGGSIDHIAAQIILQDWLDSQGD